MRCGAYRLCQKQNGTSSGRISSAYHFQSLNQMLDLSETNASLRNLHTIRELDVDRDLLVDVSHSVSWIPEGVSDGIMDLTLLTYLLRFRLDLGIFIQTTSDRDWVYFLMCLAVPFVESWEIRSSSARLPKQELRALCSNRFFSTLCLQRIPLSRYSSGGPQPGTKTKGSQNLCCCIP